MRRETKQYRDFAGGRGPADGGQLEILDIRNAGGELDVVIRGGVPPARQRIHFRGVIDFDFYTFGGEDWFALPRRLNSFTYRDHHEGAYHWWLLGDGTEWTFIAAYPEVAPILIGRGLTTARTLNRCRNLYEDGESDRPRPHDDISAVWRSWRRNLKARPQNRTSRYRWHYLHTYIYLGSPPVY